jgi:hypothetical protein
VTRRSSGKAVIFLVLALLMIRPSALPATAYQQQPDPPPETTPQFYDADGLFDDDQLRVLRRDGRLVQRSGIPTLVYVRAVSPDAAGRGESLEFANQVRQDWQIESAPGADDGLVLLFSWVPQNPLATTTVTSYGEHTFVDKGLSAEAIQHTIDTSVRSLVEQERPFEALIYLMRETRYAGIYTPPQPQAVSGLAASLQDALRWVAPILLLVSGTILSTFTFIFRREKPSKRHAWSLISIVLSGATALWLISVQAQSRIGVASSLLILLILATAAGIWSRTVIRHQSGQTTRRRVVPSTVTLMRMRRQARVVTPHRSAAGQ